MIKINSSLSVPERELTFTFSRSGGPGGQHVNKVNTRVTLWFNIKNSPSLTDRQKARILRNLSTRINKENILRVVSYRHRSQAANKTSAIARFIELIQKALTIARPRKKTKMPKAARERRLAAKKHRSQIKQRRKPHHPRDE